MANNSSARLAAPPPVIVDGFEGSVTDLIEVLSTIHWPILNSAAQEPADSNGVPANDGVRIVVVDVRRRHSDSSQPLTWISTGSGTSYPLTLILSDPGVDFSSVVEKREPERWRFSGTIDPNGIGVLINSVLQLLAQLTEATSNQGLVPEFNRSRAFDVAYSERN